MTQPSPVAESSRRTLRTLVGVDPTTVRVYRGPAAEALSAAFQADAVTDGVSLSLAAGPSESTPEGLGLLAHELLHVARRSSPRFVPPIVRAALRETATASASVVGTDEERQAEEVEALIRDVARAKQRADRILPPPIRPQHASGVAEARTAEGSPPGTGGTGGGPSDWSMVPAPWEPLPELMQDLPGQMDFTPLAVGEAPQGSPPSLQRAAVGRALPQSKAHRGPEAPEPAEPQEAEPPPDLDALAQQVYSVLRRRLQVEQRRDGYSGGR